MIFWLLRHAKAVPPTGGSDHERTLAPRGRRDADALGRRLCKDRLGFDAADQPDLVLCSTASRTVQTAERVLANLASPPRIEHRRALYGAAPEQVLDQVCTLDDDVGSVMVVGHNPTARALAINMDQCKVAERPFPTCALAVFRLHIDRWIDVSEGTGSLLGLFAPPY